MATIPPLSFLRMGVNNGSEQSGFQIVKLFHALINSNSVWASFPKMMNRVAQTLGIGSFLSLIAYTFYSRMTTAHEQKSQEFAMIRKDLSTWCSEKKGTPEYAQRQEAEGRILEAYASNKNELNLDQLELSSLPQSLGKLSRLTHLYLVNNQLESVPAELGNLSRLTQLSLVGNKLQSVPPELGKLSGLIHLDLSHNQLKGVPAELGNLSRLTHFILSHNELQSLPAELKDLLQLTTFELFRNKGELSKEVTQPLEDAIIARRVAHKRSLLRHLRF